MSRLRILVGISTLSLITVVQQEARAQLTNLFTDTDVGGPAAIAGSVALGPNLITQQGSGVDIWSDGDQFNFYYTPVTGDFDARVRVLSLTGPNHWSKAGLMVRAAITMGTNGALIPMSGDANVLLQTTQEVTPTESPFDPNGPQQYANVINFQWLQNEDPTLTGYNTVAYPWVQVAPSYPNTWLRITSSNGNYSFYTCQDGASWQLMGALNGFNFPATVLVGLATCTDSSDGSSALTTTVYSDFNLLNGLSITNINPTSYSLAQSSANSYLSVNTDLTFTVNSSNGVSSNGINLSVNGVDQSSNLILTGTPNSWNVTYPGPLQSNTMYNCLIKVTDVTGSIEYSTVYFDTLDVSNYTIEAEDFNFNSGQFIDNPVLSSTAGPNNYLNQVGIPSIDEFDPDPNAATAPHQFRASPELVGTAVTGDIARPQYLAAQIGDPNVEDYDVTQIVPGESWNYTRTLPAGAYEIVARCGATNDFGADDAFALGLNKVISGAATSNQVLETLGILRGTGTVGFTNWPFSYQFLTLADAFGNPTVLPLSGQTTLNVTNLAPPSGGLNINYYMFVPVTNTGPFPPYVVSVYPASGAAGILPIAETVAVISDRGTQVQPSTVQLLLTGPNNVTSNESSAISVAQIQGGTTVSWVPASSMSAGTNTITLSFGDTSGNFVTNTWSFVVTNGLFLGSNWALPLNSGIGSGFTVRDSQQTINESDTVERAEAQLVGQYLPLVTQGFDTPNVIDYYASGGTGDFPSEASAFPGIAEGGSGYERGVALEAVAYLALNRGVYTFGVYSATGFEVSAGLDPHAIINDPTNAVVLGELDTAEGGGETIFTFAVPTNGLYPFRLVYEEGNVPYDQIVQFFCISNGARILINDTNTPGAIPAYPQVAAFPPSALSIVSQSGNQTNLEFTPATCSVSPAAAVPGGPVMNTAEFFLQWQLNGSSIAGANSALYTIPSVTANNQGTYQCLVTYLGYQTITSAPVTLTVVPNTNAPVVVSAWALAGGDNGLGVIAVSFNHSMDPNTSQITGNYTVSGATVAQAVLQPNGQVVELELSAAVPPGTPVTVQNVADAAGNVAMSATTQITQLELTDVDIGSPLTPGVVEPLGANSFEVLAGGNDIWNSSDSFNFLYTPVYGDFTMTVEVNSLTPAFNYSKAGLMVRESLVPDSRDMNVICQPDGYLGNGGADAINANYRDATNGQTGTLPGSLSPVPPYPNAWIQISRSGSYFTPSYSYDGVDWIPMGQWVYSGSVSYPNQVYVGICTTSAGDAPSTYATAVYDYFSIAPTLFSAQSGSNVVLSWPNVGTYELLEANSLTPPVYWAPVTNAVATSGITNTVTVTATEQSLFFKLSQQVQ